MNTDRDEILDEEYTRQTPGLRPFSAGVLRCLRKLGYFRPVDPLATEKPSEPTPDDIARQNIVVTWMLDERQSIEQILHLPELHALDRESYEKRMTAYEFAVSPAMVSRARFEMARTERALALAAFTIEPKPGSSQGPSPQGKSSSPAG